VDWAQAALDGREEDAATRAARRQLAAEAVDIRMMVSQLAYDTSHLQSATRHIERLRLYVLSLMPVLSSIGDRVAQLKAIGGITPPLQKLLDETAAWIRDGGAEHVPAKLAADIAALEQAGEAGLTWSGILRTTLLVRLHELVSMVQHSRAIRAHVTDNDPAPLTPKAEGALAASHQAHDHGLALLSAAAAAIAVLLVCGFWILTAWPAGAGAAIMVAVACSFFAAQDDPAPAIAQMTRNALIVVVADAVYGFAILPRVETFPELMLVLLPAGLLIGVLVSRPATFGTGMVMGAVGATTLALNNGYTGDFAAYINGSLELIRSVGAAWSAERLLRAGWRDIAAAAGPQARHDRAHLTGVMMDRLGLLMPRLAAVSPGADIAAADALVDLRVGLNTIGLQREMAFLSPAEQQRNAAVLTGVAAHYQGNPLQAAAPSLRQAIDDAITGIIHRADAAQSRPHRETLMMLVGLRSVLFASAPPLAEMAIA
jgi:uncharacterized membrane protein YccC